MPPVVSAPYHFGKIERWRRHQITCFLIFVHDTFPLCDLWLASYCSIDCSSHEAIGRFHQEST